MSDLKSQRKLAAKIMKCGVNRVYIDPDVNTMKAVSLALTRADISKLIKSGSIKKRKIQGTSRKKARDRADKIKRGQRRGPGSRRGTANARSNSKTEWIYKIRAQRRYLKKLRDEGYITPATYRTLYRQSKGNMFRSVRYLSSYIAERDLAEKKLPPYTRK